MVLYNSNGAIAQNLGTGKLTVQGQDNSGNYFFFFTNSNLNGSVFSLNYGFPNNNGFSFTGTNNPTVPQTNTMAGSGSVTPLGSGQSGGGNSAPTLVNTTNSTITTSSINGTITSTYNQPVTVSTYSDNSTTTSNNGPATLISTSDSGGGNSITATQQFDVINFNNNTIINNGIYIQQIGNNDIISISQIGAQNLIGGINQKFAQIQDGNNYISIKQGNGNYGKNEIDLNVLGGSNNLYLVQGSDPAGISAGNNYQLININGFSNSITTSQTNDGGSGHFLEAIVRGNYNTVGITQDTNGQKQLFSSITGNSNTLNSTQTGTGQHLLNVNMQGNSNSAIVSQSGVIANTANITLINAGAPASINLTQTGGQSYNITQTCYTICGTITVKQ
jgi:hypothetical protein